MTGMTVMTRDDWDNQARLGISKDDWNDKG